MKGPTLPPIFAISLEFLRKSTKRSMTPAARRPAANTPAAMMMPMMLAYPLPMPSKNFFEISCGLERVTASA